jgi:AraC-like DNA-binding protein
LKRRGAQPAVQAPACVEAVGCHVLVAGEVRMHFARALTQVFWGLDGMAKFAFRSRRVTLRANQVFAYPSHIRHDIVAGPEGARYVWWTMDGPFADALLIGFGLGPHVLDAGPPPLALFRRLANLLQRDDPRSEHRAGLIGYRLMATARLKTDSRREEGGLDQAVHECRRLIDDGFVSPSLGIEQIADDLGINRSLLARRFQWIYGVTPREFLNQRRMGHAVFLLNATDNTIKKIASQCGFSDANYFSRVFMKYHGKSPRIYRYFFRV